jgi:hypothetical protein
MWVSLLTKPPLYGSDAGTVRFRNRKIGSFLVAASVILLQSLAFATHAQLTASPVAHVNYANSDGITALWLALPDTSP